MQLSNGMATMTALLTLSSLLSIADGTVVTGTVRTCEPIKIEMCRGLGYDVTGMPNMLNNELQQDAKMQLQTFRPLIQYGCSNRLKFFLCSAYVPMCTEKVAEVIGPCRPLCEDVRDRCLPVLQKFGFPWPPALNCSKFHPENNQYTMCMPGPEIDEDEDEMSYSPPTNVFQPTVETRLPPVKVDDKEPTPHPHTYNYGLCDQYSKMDSYYYINRTGKCAHLCSANINFTQKERKFADLWMGIMAVLCFLSTIITFLTFMMDLGSFKFPERPVVFISMCYCIYSLAYVVRLFAGRDVIACHPEPQWNNVQILVLDGLENTNCAIVFMLVYFFGMASAMWWLVLTVTWLLAAGMKWSHDAIDVKTSYFHVAAWALPAVLTITALIRRVVDADELTGMCYIGNRDPDNLIMFVVVPQLIFLVSGIAILLIGFHLAYKNRHKRRRTLGGCQGDSVHVDDKLEGMTIRVIVFSFVYVVPSACIVATYIYEYKYRHEWLTSEHSKPNVDLFILRIFMSLIVGTISGLVIWPVKIWRSWRRLVSNGHPTKSSSGKLVYYQKAANNSRTVVMHNAKTKRVKCNKPGGETSV